MFAIPEGLSDEDAAPMLCGGLTVFAPMKNYGVKKGSKVAVIGIGGLGHFAIQFAKALGAEVTAFGHSPDKEADAKKMGAKDYVSCLIHTLGRALLTFKLSRQVITKEGFAKDHAMEFEFILSTVDDAAVRRVPASAHLVQR